MADGGQNSLQNFMSHLIADAPSYSSLYHVQFGSLPKVLVNQSGTPKLGPEYSNAALVGLNRNLGRNLNYYASEVTIPSRQITTGEMKSVGAMYRYPTSTTFSEVSIQFVLTRSLMTRIFFERWMNYITSDADQYVDYYDNSVCPVLKIYKLERGGGGKIPPKEGINPIIGTKKNGEPGRLQGEFNKISGVWALYNVFPFNISSFTIGNGPSQIINMEVTFYFERYRFHSISPNDTLIPKDDTTPSTKSSNLQSQSQAQINAALGNKGATYNWNSLNPNITQLAFNQQAALIGNINLLAT